MIIHKRFNNPEPFLKLVREYAVGDKEDAWFTSLTLTSFDLAESLRTKFGEVITDLPQGLKNRGIITIEDCEWLSTIL
jgi:myosin-crossreactive antigen